MHTGKQMQAEVRIWLSPPDPSINHNVACGKRLEGTAMWIIQDSKFNEWKKRSSLLWIRGIREFIPPSQPFMTVNPFPDLSAGSGKSILWCVVSWWLR